MIDHVGFSVSDYAHAKASYERALAPLGYTLIMEATVQETGQPAAGFGSGGKPDFWIGGEGVGTPPIVIGIVRMKRPRKLPAKGTTLPSLIPPTPTIQTEIIVQGVLTQRQACVVAYIEPVSCDFEPSL